MDWVFNYNVMLANGDGDSGEWTEELTQDELDALLDAIIDGDDFEAAMERSGAKERVLNVVLSDVGSDLMDSCDLYDEPQEDREWIYDEGCEAEVTPQEPDLSSDALILQLIKRAVRRSRAEGTGIVKDVLSRFGGLYSEDPEELALGFAVQYNARAYLAECRRAEAAGEPAPEAEAEAPETAAAPAPAVLPAEESFVLCKFAVRMDNWKILAFTKAFQEEVFQTLLDENDLEREDVVAFLEGNGDEPAYRGDLKRTLRAIGVFPYGGDVAFENMLGEDGCEAAELIDWLGIDTLTRRGKDFDVCYIP